MATTPIRTQDSTLVEYTVAKVADFGLSRVVGDGPAPSSHLRSTCGHSNELNARPVDSAICMTGTSDECLQPVAGDSSLSMETSAGCYMIPPQLDALLSDTHRPAPHHAATPLAAHSPGAGGRRCLAGLPDAPGVPQACVPAAVKTCDCQSTSTKTEFPASESPDSVVGELPPGPALAGSRAARDCAACHSAAAKRCPSSCPSLDARPQPLRSPHPCEPPGFTPSPSSPSSTPCPRNHPRSLRMLRTADVCKRVPAAAACVAVTQRMLQICLPG